MITNNKKKGKSTCEKTHNFITYFQSVTTIGIVSTGKTAKEAEQKSLQKLNGSQLTCGVIGQTPFSVSETEEWQIDLSSVTPSPSTPSETSPTE